MKLCSDTLCVVAVSTVSYAVTVMAMNVYSIALFEFDVCVSRAFLFQSNLLIFLYCTDCMGSAFIPT